MRGTAAENTILIVEDDAVAREGLTTLVQREGYRPVLAGDAQEAMTLLRGGLRPRLVLLDMILPAADGWHFFAERLRIPEIAGIPVVIMTGLGVASPEWALSLGAVDLLRKPFDINRLLAVVRRHVEGEAATPK
jgi:chemosensory pili system protein ChpA (sensor histidine kinase/response regulator)